MLVRLPNSVIHYALFKYHHQLLYYAHIGDGARPSQAFITRVVTRMPRSIRLFYAHVKLLHRVCIY
jgi:hypothetical protein